MFDVRYLLAASIGACLLGGVAVAQPTSTAPTASANQPTASQDQTAPAATDHATRASETTTEPANVIVTTTVDAYGDRHLVISNPPVPDTPDNRAKYGRPLSDAGRRTQPAGN